MTQAFNQDCMEAMREFPDGYFDLAVVDPMYGIGENGSKAKSRSNLVKKCNDYKPIKDEKPGEEYFAELFRVTKNQVIWGANHMIEGFCKNASCWLIWDKLNGDTNYADCELAWTSFKGAARKFEWRWQGMIQQNGNRSRQHRIHPCEKPIALYRWIFQKFTKPGDKILDTHLGSGSSRIAAYDAGLDFWGYEIDPDYFAAQEERFRAHANQINLFLDYAEEGKT